MARDGLQAAESPERVGRGRTAAPASRPRRASSDRFVDAIAEGYDAGIRIVETIHRDMVHVQLTGESQLVVAGAPAYLAKHGTPNKVDPHSVKVFDSSIKGEPDRFADRFVKP